MNTRVPITYMQRLYFVQLLPPATHLPIKLSILLKHFKGN